MMASITRSARQLLISADDHGVDYTLLIILADLTFSARLSAFCLIITEARSSAADWVSKKPDLITGFRGSQGYSATHGSGTRYANGFDHRVQNKHCGMKPVRKDEIVPTGSSRRN